MSSVTRDVWLWLYGIERHSVNDLVRLLLGKLFRRRARDAETQTAESAPARAVARTQSETVLKVERARARGTRARELHTHDTLFPFQLPVSS